MSKLLKLVAVVVALGAAAAFEPPQLLAQCAKCDALQPGGCAYGPFAQPNYDRCTFVVGLCFEAGVCGESFAANQATFSLDGMAVVPARVATSAEEVIAPTELETRFVLRHCSGLIATVTD